MSNDVSRIESPITMRGYLLCGFAAFGGILFGYDSGYINGVLGMDFFKKEFGRAVDISVDPSGYNIHVWEKSLITSILSAGTFFGALFGGNLADWIGRRLSIIIACFIFSIGVALQVASTAVGLLVGGRVIAGFGVGLVSAIVIMYMSEIAPKAVRGAIVAGYQWAITLGLLLAACVNQATHNWDTHASYRVPIAIQFVWAFILATGLFFLPESPRWYVKQGRHEEAATALARLRGQPASSDYIKDELAEIQANFEYEMSISQAGWADCFKGLGPSGNFRRVLIGVFLQMFQQLTGVNFIFYYGTTFFQTSGIKNAFLISLITNLVNVITTPIAFWGVEKMGRRKLLLIGAIVMLVCEFIVGAVGTALPGSQAASTCLVVFVCFYIFGFATTWGPSAWIIIGELYPLPIRAKGVALATASNWLWNFVLGYVTPYMVDPTEGNLGAKVFFVWGTTCVGCFLFAYFFVPETKGLSLEQVDRMLEETTPRTSSKWVPHETYAHRAEKKQMEA
ncbi:Similar to Probable glucose transporter rco-3; acc. no. Q92253 [Pyronema omphalodes CBS 100304]|uniref:Similar to Probable glucose transporter rco-3 acc. no. Q92253 n=1 Tax=Pyronema omphalodes (strain CBS 100304) TaxID=1076935 RepID=U4L3T7_PYROM|nr:Similar to Probable glucose transporter rco-3; acc. no. Q92253 [Pyronema omphalodes CBS 100304]